MLAVRSLGAGSTLATLTPSRLRLNQPDDRSKAESEHGLPQGGDG